MKKNPYQRYLESLAKKDNRKVAEAPAKLENLAPQAKEAEIVEEVEEVKIVEVEAAEEIPTAMFDYVALSEDEEPEPLPEIAGGMIDFQEKLGKFKKKKR